MINNCMKCGSSSLNSVGRCMNCATIGQCPYCGDNLTSSHQCGSFNVKTIESSQPRIVMVLSPYTSDSYEVIKKRVEQTQDYFMKLLELGMTPFSAIMQCHDVAVRKGKDTSFVEWGKYCLDMMTIADEIHVLMLDGWEESVGVRQEISRAKSLNLPVSYVAG